MPASSFDKRNVSSSRQPWLSTLTPGAGLSNLFSLYPSKGDATIDAATTIPSLLDGPIQVARYGALTVNAALTVANRCRGGVILADSLSMGAAGAMSMTARGAAGSSKWANQDIGIPTSMVLSGKNTSQRAFLDWIAETGYFIGDPTIFKCPPTGMGDVQADWSTWPAKMSAIVSAAGCGIGGAGGYGSTAGIAGGAGTSAPGGGGSGARATGAVPPGASGRVWSGGSASGGAAVATLATSQLPGLYGGNGGDGSGTTSGGGAGNPGGAYSGTGGHNGSDGTGGVLIVIVRGNVTLATGHTLSANGSSGGSCDSGGSGGGGSGGGLVALYYGGVLTGTPNITATGGGGGTGSSGYNGGAGGAGATVVSTFSAKGWA